MCMMWLLLPYKSPTMVWGFAGKGLRTTISLEGFYDKVLANFLQINIGTPRPSRPALCCSSRCWLS